MDFIPAVAMLALIAKLVDLARYIRWRDLNGVTTQLTAWIAGTAVVMLVAQTTWADTVAFGNETLAELGLWSQIFVGLSIASGASLAKDTLKAIDNTTCTQAAPLVPDPPPESETSTWQYQQRH